MIDCNFYRFIDNNPRGKFEPAASDLQTLLVFFQHPACVITPVNLVESAVFCFCNCKVKYIYNDDRSFLTKLGARCKGYVIYDNTAFFY